VSTVNAVPTPGPWAGEPEPATTNGPATAALALGAIAFGLALTWFLAVLAIFPASAAIALGVIGIARAGRHPLYLGRGQAMLAIVLGLIAIAVFGVQIVLALGD